MTNRQERATDKKEVLVYLPMQLYDYLCALAEENGLSKSAQVVTIIRQKMFHKEEAR